MNDSRIRNIIRESIYNLINEIDEANNSIHDMENAFMKRNNQAFKKAKRKELGLPEKERKKRFVPKTILDADSDNPSHIRRTLRKSWNSSLYPMYHLLTKNIKQFGDTSGKWLLQQFGELDDYGNPTGMGLDTLYNMEYDKLDACTSAIEGYGNDIRNIKSKLREIPPILNNITTLLYKMCDKCKEIRIKVSRGDMPPEVNPRIIDGYMTSAGLKDKAIYYGKGSKKMRDLTNYLNDISNLIESYGNDEYYTMTDTTGIKTIRR